MMLWWSHPQQMGLCFHARWACRCERARVAGALPASSAEAFAVQAAAEGVLGHRLQLKELLVAELYYEGRADRPNLRQVHWHIFLGHPKVNMEKQLPNEAMLKERL